jgi:hypothetical protein
MEGIGFGGKGFLKEGNWLWYGHSPQDKNYFQREAANARSGQESRLKLAEPAPMRPG